MSHRCPGPACPEIIPNSLLMCRHHWGLVPKHLQLAVYRAYKRGRGLYTAELTAAQDAAIASVRPDWKGRA